MPLNQSTYTTQLQNNPHNIPSYSSAGYGHDASGERRVRVLTVAKIKKKNNDHNSRLQFQVMLPLKKVKIYILAL